MPVIDVTTADALRAAIVNAKGGDEIVVANGSYEFTSDLSCSAVGAPTTPIIVRSATPLGAKIELKTVEGFKVSGAHWHFEGLDIKGTCATDTDCEHAFHVVGGATGFVLRNNRIVDFNAQLKVNASINGGGAGNVTFAHGGLIEGNELFDTHARDTSNPITKLNIDTGDNWIVRANYIHDFKRVSDVATYGAFMKSGGKNGLFERNLVVCRTNETGPTPSVHVGLSFGGGGTAPQFCAPAFDAGVECAVEHENGIMRNNIIASCTDVGIYINRGKNTKLLHNTLVATTGIDFRFETTTGEARGNVLGSVIRDRNTATHTEANNLPNISPATFEAMYMAPLAGDLRLKGDVSALLAKAPASTDVPDDYCARTRTGMWDLGALQHGLGDCVTNPPPLGTSTSSSGGSTTSSSGDGGASSTSSSSSSGSGGDGGASTSSGGGGGPGAAPGDDDGCGCRTTGSSTMMSRASIFVLGALLALALRRRRV